MMNRRSPLLLLTTILLFCTARLPASSAEELQSRSEQALDHLYAKNDRARELGEKACAILVFPSVVKAAFIAGGQRGDGVLYEGGQAAGYYNLTSASYGLQAGLETYSLALFFTTQEDLDTLKKTSGFKFGTAPCITVADKGLARELSFYTLRGVRAFAFKQKGLMGALGLQATKISRYTPSR